MMYSMESCDGMDSCTTVVVEEVEVLVELGRHQRVNRFLGLESESFANSVVEAYSVERLVASAAYLVAMGLAAARVAREACLFLCRSLSSRPLVMPTLPTADRSMQNCLNPIAVVE